MATEDNDPIIVKADEVDEAGADISAISPADASDFEFTERIESRRAQDAQPHGSPKILANAASSPPRLQPLARPGLRREGSVPAPPQQPPPAALTSKPEETSNPTDSLSLLQLRHLVTGLPKIEPAAYAYRYSETSSFSEELQEWFQYAEHEAHILLKAKHTFIQTWEQAVSERPETSDKALEWPDVQEEDRVWFLECAMQALDSLAPALRLKALECMSYVALGAWHDTAGVGIERPTYYGQDFDWSEIQSPKSGLQMRWIMSGAQLLFKIGALPKLVNMLQNCWRLEQSIRPGNGSRTNGDASSKQLELDHILTLLYVLVESSRWQTGSRQTGDSQAAQAIIDSDLLLLLTQIIAKSRWEEPSDPTIFPRHRLFLLIWKVSLLTFGGFSDLESCRTNLSEELDKDDIDDEDYLMTASPLDYHIFRQEITSKYPAYNPPPPLLPIELENNSILPPLPNHPSRQPSQSDLQGIVGNAQAAGGSILNQAVHIATPAPSPPPSPAGPGGKGGKKQNYQTNQNFPFLYPPATSTSEQPPSLGGGGIPKRALSKRQWEENNVPASILEAGQLFASRTRMSRSIRQLWDVREEFIQAERGWNEQGERTSEMTDSTNFDLDAEAQTGDERRRAESNETMDEPQKSPQFNDQRQSSDEEDVQRRLDAVENYYRKALPELQSFVIVLFKELFQNVQSLILQNGPNGMQNSTAEDAANDGPGKKKTNPNSSASLNGMANGALGEVGDVPATAIEGLNEIRSREISSKAVSGILLVLLKWFKLSHIMKFEYLTQLLLDANFLPLILKYFAHQDIDKSVEHRNDRHDLDFFYFCQINSKNPPQSPAQPPLSSSNSSSEDEAAAPPISRHRRSPTYHSPPPTPPPHPPSAINRPEVDELGFPASGTALPTTPLTKFAPRFFLININLLRLLQKITKRKAHRALLLVQYKSSTILRKALKIPQPDLRLYTLKLFKSQVPYCGRKWRQANMRVITAIYLHCRPQLRDEWLCGGDVDGVVEEALPLEQAGRSLVHWWHLRYFRDVMEGSGMDDSTADSSKKTATATAKTKSSSAALATMSGAGMDEDAEDEEEDANVDEEAAVAATAAAAAESEKKVGIGAEPFAGSEEYDFFARELDKLGWGFAGMGLSSASSGGSVGSVGGGRGVGGGGGGGMMNEDGTEDALGPYMEAGGGSVGSGGAGGGGVSEGGRPASSSAAGRTEFDGGPLQMEGWA